MINCDPSQNHESMAPTTELNVEKAAALFRNANVITVLTGAGISAESGIQTFRDTPDSLWNRFDPAILSSLNGFAADPQLVWDWYIDRRTDMLAAQPNAAHVGLATIDKKKDLQIFTQNIDDLHERAGSESVTHFHGDIKTARCFAGCGWEGKFEDTRSGGMPGCPNCASIARPNVVWFGENLDLTTMTHAKARLQNTDLHIVIGTSGVVEPVASIIYNNAREGSTILSINKRKSDHLWYADYTMTGSAGWILEAIAKLV
jgi:NAD-dependent deacetylase